MSKKSFISSGKKSDTFLVSIIFELFTFQSKALFYVSSGGEKRKQEKKGQEKIKVSGNK